VPEPRLSNTVQGTVLVFDGDCAFCTSAVNRITQILPRSPERIVPSQRLSDADLASYGLSRAQVADAAWLVTRRRAFGGHRAASALLRMQPSILLRILGAMLTLPPADAIGAVAYHWVAANRHRLPGGTPACELP